MRRVARSRVTAFARLALLCAIAGCASQSRKTDTLTAQMVGDTVANPNAFWASVGVQFHPESISVGDTIGSMIVDRIAVQKAYDSTAVGSVWFRGELELKGRMIPHFDSDVRAQCFEADSLSASRMPRWSGDLRRPWFCFREPPAGIPIPRTDSTEGTIVIDRFTIHFTMSDAVNEGQLRRLVLPNR